MRRGRTDGWMDQEEEEGRSEVVLLNLHNPPDNKGRHAGRDECIGTDHPGTGNPTDRESVVERQGPPMCC